MSGVPITGAFAGSNSGTPGGVDRAASVGQAVPSGLKVKLSLSNSGKVGTGYGVMYLVTDMSSCRTVRPCLRQIRYLSPDL